MKQSVTIVVEEISKREVYVDDCNSEEEAKVIVSSMMDDEEIVLDYNDVVMTNLCSIEEYQIKNGDFSIILREPLTEDETRKKMNSKGNIYGYVEVHDHELFNQETYDSLLDFLASKLSVVNMNHADYKMVSAIPENHSIIYEVKGNCLFDL